MNRLLLYVKQGELPQDSDYRVIDVLEKLQFTGERFSSEEAHSSNVNFYVGERFIDHITFLGCSPAIALSPEDGEQFCFVCVNELSDKPRLYYGSNTPAPHCRQCKETREDWKLMLDDGDTFCTRCNMQERQQSLVWRKMAAISRLAIEIMHVYPHEAVPSPHLLEELAKVTNVEWAYAYLQA